MRGCDHWFDGRRKEAGHGLITPVVTTPGASTAGAALWTLILLIGRIVIVKIPDRLKLVLILLATLLVRDKTKNL